MSGSAFIALRLLRQAAEHFQEHHDDGRPASKAFRVFTWYMLIFAWASLLAAIALGIYCLI